MNEETINYFINEGYYICDLSTINNINNYKKYKFYKNKCYDKTIFYYNILLLSDKIIKYYALKLTGDYKSIIGNNYVYFYKKSFLFSNSNINDTKIISIKNILLSNDKYYTCNICFNKYSIIYSCYKCNFTYCNKCVIKLNYNKKNACIVCKFSY